MTFTFDILKIGAKIESNGLNDDAYNDNSNLYIIPSFSRGISKNINVYDISTYNEDTVPIVHTYPLYDSLDITKYLLVKTDNEYSSSSNVTLISADMSRYYYIDKNTNKSYKKYINETVNNFDSVNFNNNQLYSKIVYHNTNNTIYSIPFNTSNIGIYNISSTTGTPNSSLHDISTQINGTNIDELFNSGIIRNNKLYLIPYNFSNVLVYDISTSITFDIEIEIDVDVDKKYSHAVLAGNDIYCIPFNANHILKINEKINGTYNVEKITHNDILDSISKYSYGILYNSYRIYLVPSNKSKIAYYDINTKKIIEIGDIILGPVYKFSNGIIINNVLYLIPYNYNKIVTLNILTNTIKQLFDLSKFTHNGAYNEMFSEVCYNNVTVDPTIYLIPARSGYIGALRYPYDNLDCFYTVRIDNDSNSNKKIIGYHYHNNKLYLMSSGYHINIVDITINKNTYKYKSFIGGSTPGTNTRNIFGNLDNTNFLFRNYISAFYVNNTFYLLEASGKFITEYDNDIIIDIEILQDDRTSEQYRAKVNFNNTVKIGNTIYTVIGNNNIFTKYDISTRQSTYLDLREYNFTSTDKFLFGLYSRFTKKVYFIPYNIPKIGIIDNNDEITYVELNGLQNINNLFRFAIEYNGYIYLIPYNSDFIYIYNVIDNIFTKIDISSFSIFKKTNKFINAFIHNERIILVPSDSGALGYLDYDLVPGSRLEGNANFNLINGNLFTFDNTSLTYDIQIPLTIGINTKYKATYKFGTLLVNLYTDDIEQNGVYKWDLESSTNISSTKNFSNFVNTDNTAFIDDNNETIFKIYEPTNEDDNSLKLFNVNDFLSNQKILSVSVTNIYSLYDNSIYFIPYNFNYLLKLELSQTPNVLKIIDISYNLVNIVNFMTNMNTNKVTGKFNLSIIVDDNLYMIPFVENDVANKNFYPFVIYNLITKTTSFIDIGFSNNPDSLFCCILFTRFSSDKVLYLIMGDTTKNNQSILYDIENEKIEYVSFYNTDTNIFDITNLHFFDGYLYIDGITKFILLLCYDNNTTETKIKKFRIQDKTNLIHTKDIDIGDVNITNKYSKIIGNDSKIYFIPFNTNKLGIYDYNDDVFSEKEITQYHINQELFKGGAIISLDNKVYLVMVPYGADRIYIYNISEQSFTFIKDPLFKTNKFENCTVDLKGNMYMNTSDGNTLFYKLSIRKNYILPRLPVYSDTLSFKYLYQKFHKNYSYDGYNFGNKIIKFSDYYNNGGSTYHTISQLNEDKYIVDNDPTITDAVSTESITSYEQFITNNSDNTLKLSEYEYAYSSRYENYIIFTDIGSRSIEYIISGISVSNNNKYFYYVKYYDNGKIVLSGKNIKNYTDLNIITIPVVAKTEVDEFIINVENYSDSINVQTGIINVQENRNRKVIIRLEKHQSFNDNLVINTSFFDKFENLQEIEFDILGTYKSGITINIDSNVRNNLGLITVLNNPSGIIQFDDSFNDLITITSVIQDAIDVNLKESIVLEEITVSVSDINNLQSDILNLIFQTTTNNRVTKITVDILDTPNSFTSANLNIEEIVSKLPYCHTIVIITKSINISINFIGTNEIKNNLNVIIYENID